MNYDDELYIEGAMEGGSDPIPQEDALPAYLRRAPVPEKTYGTLSYNTRRRAWTIKGDPAVTQLAKRLFPGCDAGRRGIATFTAHWRFIADLNWLMMRYPLSIAPRDQARWEQALQETREKALRLETYRIYPVSIQPSSLRFTATLMPFQQEGVGFLAYHQRALLADEMGLGKTVQALAQLVQEDRWPVLLVVPPHLITNWQREIARFLRMPGNQGEETSAARVHVLRGLTPYALPEADIYIIHYLLLRGWKTALPQYRFHAVIFDEIQELRHAGTEKYAAASLLADSAQIVYGLSGTPIYNHGGEIYHVMNIIDYHCLGDWESFTREWCYGYGNHIVAKPELLGDHLRQEGLMLRRTKSEVLTQLPAKRRIVQEVDADSAIYQEETQRLGTLMQELVTLQGGVSLDASRAALLREQIVAVERQATGLAKAPWVSAFTGALIEAGERVLLFAHHHSVFDVYKRHLKRYHPVFITGRETQKAKDRAVQSFMEGRSPLCCISLRAAAGLNLQRATCVVFGELDWSPAVHSQAEDRAHRIGQTDSLLCYYLVCSQGSDQDMQEALGLKVSQFVRLMGQPQEAPEDRDAALDAAEKHIDRVITRLQERYNAHPTGDSRH